MTELSKRAQGSFISTGNDYPVYLPFTPDFVRVWNMTANAHPTDGSITYMMWNSFMSPLNSYTLIYENGVLIPRTVLVSGITRIYDGVSLKIDAPNVITVVTPGSLNTTVQFNGSGYADGDVVMLEGLHETPSTGMPQICGIPFKVTSSSPGNTSFTIKWNTNQSNYTAISPGTGSKIRRLVNPFLYSPRNLIIMGITLGRSTTIVTTVQHNLYVGQEVAFRIPPQWGTVELNSSRNAYAPNASISAVVSSVVDDSTVIVNIDSTSYTPFHTNIPVANIPGLTFPQMLAVGNVSMGGTPISRASQLYPSPIVEKNEALPTVNGPTINGAFINNTSQGFLLSANTGGIVNPDSSIGDTIYWEASLHEYAQGIPLPIV